MVISVNNGAYIKAVKLKDKKYRDEYGLMLVEGEKLVKDALKYGYEAESIFLTEGKQTELYDSIKRYTVTERMMKRLSAKTTPQGIVALIRKKPNEPKIPEGKSLILENIQDPGNLGAILRTACGAGYNDVYCCGGADPYSPKSLASGMSAQFAIRIYECGIEQAFALNGSNEIICCDMNGESLYSFRAKTDHALVLGNEGQGVSKYVTENSEKKIGIPMENGLESLNVAVSAGIMMYMLKRSV